jgi:WhiB family redox-sensing transcriptional regulator|tara:strand:- start:210 stop:533 length:324 start_codon:yes stop_codon:yes gene_type:complete
MVNQVIGTLHIPDFTEKARPLCADEDPELFFPQEVEYADGTTHSSYTNLPTAKAICGACPVAVDCLTYALKNHELGVWGGTTEDQRKALRRRNGISLIKARKTPNRL